jgi:hypothetical protein
MSRRGVKVEDRFGRLRVVAEAGRNKHGQRVWRCLCDCQAVAVVSQPNLVSGGQRSCGCLRTEANVGRTKHGHAAVGHVSREYSLWLVMKDRCLNPDSRGWKDYGGRGITVCDEWQDSFEAFLRDMGPRPSPAHSIERRQNDGPYAKWNCVWATRDVQAANTRRNRKVMLDGEPVHVSEAARRKGLSERTILSRLRLGWSGDELFLPPDIGRVVHGRRTGRPPRRHKDAAGGQQARGL